MAELITTLVKLFMDNTVKFFPRLIVVVLIILGLMAIDSILGFTFHYNKQRTISELHEVSELISDSTIDAQTRAKAIKMKNEILSRTTVQDFINDALIDIFRPINVEKHGVIVKQYTHERNRVIEFFCLNWFLVFLFVFLPPYFLIKPAFDKLWKNLLMILAVNLFLIILSFIIFFVFSLIPTINGQPLINYILDFSVLFLILMINSYRTNKDNWFVNRK